MIREAIGVGTTVEAATEDAKRQLGLDDTSDVECEYEVVQYPEKKKFGLFGGAPAKVRISYEIKEEIKEEPVKVKPEVEVKAVNKDKPKDKPVTKKDEPEAKPSKPAAPSDRKAEKFLRDVLDAMKLESIEIESKEGENSLEFNLSGEEVGFVIGRRGDTLDALQYLTGLVANHKNEGEYIKVSVNTGNYREKREKTLEILGRKLAFKALKTGKKTPLEPMNPYERRIIHTAVQKVNGATSWSEGEGPARHVVIGPDPKARNHRRGGYGNRRGGKRPYNGGKNSAPAPVNPDRVPLNEGGETGGLYGRIGRIEK